MEWVKFTTLMITFLLRSSSVPRLTARLSAPSPHPPTISLLFSDPVYILLPDLPPPLPSLSSNAHPSVRVTVSRPPARLAFVNITNPSGRDGFTISFVRNGGQEGESVHGSFYRDVNPWSGDLEFKDGSGNTLEDVYMYSLVV